MTVYLLDESRSSMEARKMSRQGLVSSYGCGSGGSFGEGKYRFQGAFLIARGRRGGGGSPR